MASNESCSPEPPKYPSIHARGSAAPMTPTMKTPSRSRGKYLNAILKGCVYRPEAGILSFRHEGKFFTLSPRRAAITRVADDADAQRTLLWLQDLINRAYSARETITPSYKSCDVLKALDVYRLLPGFNCGQCGEATCLAFALKVVAQSAEIDSCRPLSPGSSRTDGNRWWKPSSAPATRCRPRSRETLRRQETRHQRQASGRTSDAAVVRVGERRRIARGISPDARRCVPGNSYQAGSARH